MKFCANAKIVKVLCVANERFQNVSNLVSPGYFFSFRVRR